MGLLMLKTITEEVALSVSQSFFQSDAQNSEELYEEMYRQQPILKLMSDMIIDNEELSMDFKIGYCKSMLQTWHLLNQQYIIDEL